MLPTQTLLAQRKATRAFIAVNPVSLALIPREKVKQPAGGFRWSEKDPRPSQTMTLLEQTGLSAPTVTLDGVERRVEFGLLAEWDAAMAVGDVFLHQSRTWEIVGIAYDNGYERRALVSARG